VRILSLPAKAVIIEYATESSSIDIIILKKSCVIKNGKVAAAISAVTILFTIFI
jgi:hypothetical protein